MRVNREAIILLGLSLGLTVGYVVVPSFIDIKKDYGEFAGLANALATIYVFVLPGAIGIAAALLLHGQLADRIVQMALPLALPLAMASVFWGWSGLNSDAFRIGMILLAIVSAIYLSAGLVASLVVQRRAATGVPPTPAR